MPSGEDWLLSPVGAGMCKYESLIDGTLGLCDVADMNDFLAVRRDNESLMNKKLMESRNGSK